MQTLKGKAVFREITFGKLLLYKRIKNKIKRYHVDNAVQEIDRFNEAKNLSVKQLGELYQEAAEKIGETDAMIFYIHQMMLNDVDFTDSVISIITEQKLNAETAVAITCSNLAKMFSMLEDVYMREREADINDISERVIANLAHSKPAAITFSEPVIIVADDLAPSETMQLDKSKILAFITENGSDNSHTAILARTLNIPALIAAKGILNENFNGQEAILDGFSDRVYIQPDEETVSKLSDKKRHKEELITLKQMY